MVHGWSLSCTLQLVSSLGEITAILNYVSLFLLRFLKINLFYLFIFDCVGSSLLRVGFLYVWREGATLRCNARESHCRGFSRCGARVPVVVAHGLSSCGSWALEHSLVAVSSCGTQT